MNDDIPWCHVFQSPHSPNFCVVAQSFCDGQQLQNNDDFDNKDQEDITCNMIHLCDSDGESDVNEPNHDITN